MPRRDPDQVTDERTMLGQYLDYHRDTVLWKVERLTDEQATTPPIASTGLTIAGLVKHLALVEDSWFQEDFLGLEVPEPWRGLDWDADPDWEFRTANDDGLAAVVDLYLTAIERSRATVSAATSLDQLSIGRSRRTGEPWSLRWVLLHMIEETARHNGHLDLLREAIDGVVGE